MPVSVVNQGAWQENTNQGAWQSLIGAIQKPLVFDGIIQRLADADSLGLVDSYKLYFVTGNDVSIVYNGTKLIFDVEQTTDLIAANPDGDDTDFVFGSSQLDDTGVAAQDSRIFFDKGKGAFRAGEVSGTEWDTANVGDQSVAFGLNCIASENYSFAFGQDSKANKYGQHAQASGYFTAAGDAQSSTFTVRKSVEHSDDSWYPLFLDGVDDQLTISTNTVWTFGILLVGTTDGCTKSFGFKIEGVVENANDTTTILASNVTTLYDSDDTGFDARVAADDGTDALVIEVTDSTSGGDTVRWVAKILITEMTY